MKLVLIRHQPTAWNREEKLQGRRDISIELPDDAAQVLLALEVAFIAANEPFDYVACSTLKRTQETATWSGYPQAEADPLLDELDFGLWEGRPREEFLRENEKAWLSAPETLVLGESIASLGERVRAYVEKRKDSRTVLAFAHGAWMRAARSLHDSSSLVNMTRREIGNSEALILDFSKK